MRKLRRVAVAVAAAGMTLAMGFGLTACGESAYDIAVKNGFQGSEQEWLQSLKGDKGDKGDSGQNGTNGKEGVDGTNGKDGTDGAGSTNGKDGKNGKDGTLFYTGAREPDGAFGVEGDLYLETNTMDLYKKNAEGQWEKVANLKGTTGEKGETGAEGAHGVKGDEGEKGDKGERGTLWFSGVNEPEKAPATIISNPKHGDFYLRRYSELSGKKGYQIYGYQNDAWTLMIDMTAELSEEEKKAIEEKGLSIENADELVELSDLVNSGNNFEGKTIKLTADIDLKNVKWTPIGTKDHPFKGTFDGAKTTDEEGLARSSETECYKISNLRISLPNQDNVGLFGYVPNGAIKNLVLENVTVTGQSGVAALVGEAFTIGEISNVTVRGSIKITGNYKVGGIVGGSYGNVKNCTVSGKSGSYIKGVYKAEPSNCEGDNVGGIIGYTGELNGKNGEAEADHITGCEVSGVTVSGTRKVGGVVGYLHHGQGVSSCSFKNGTVECTAEDDYIQSKGIAMIAIGGIVGQAHGENVAQSIKNNKVDSITINAPKSYTFETVCKENGEEKSNVLTSAILGNVRDCNKSTGIAHAAKIEASGNEATNVTVKALLKDVVYSSERITSVLVENVDDILSVQKVQKSETDIFRNWSSEQHTTVSFAEGVYDLKDVEWTPFNGYWFNYIGNDVTIKNMTMKKAQWRGGFVDSMGSCTIEGFTFENATIIGEQAAVVAGHTMGGTIKNVTIKGTVSVKYEKTSKEEEYPGIGFVVGVLAEGNTKFENVKLDAGAKATLDFGGDFTTQCTAVNFLAGYKASGNIEGMPEQEDGAEVTVKGLKELNVSENSVIPNHADYGMNLDPGADLIIDGDLGNGKQMEIELKHTAFNYFNITEGITEGKIVIRNVHFKGTDENAHNGYAMTLGFNSTAEVVFENCTFENMHCAIYCNQNTSGSAKVTIRNCEFKNTDWGYGISPDSSDEAITVTFDGNTGLDTGKEQEKFGTEEG